MINTKNCATVFFLLFASLGFSQQLHLDSLRQVFHLEKDPLKKTSTYYEWAYLLLNENPETGLATADTLEQLAKEADSKKDLSRAEYLRGYGYILQGKFEDALPHHRRELALALQTNDLELKGKALNSYGNCFHDMGRNDSAIVYLTQSAKVKEQVGNQKDLASAYANIGNVFSDEKASDKAIEYLEKALKIRLSLPGGERSAIFTYNNLSVAYGGKGDTDKAIEYAQKGYELAESSNNNFLAGVLAGNLSELWLDKDEVDKAIELAQKSVDVLSELNRRANIVYPYTVLSEAWWHKGDFAKALEANLRGYAIMEELKLGEPLAVYYKNFANVYESMGDDKQALFWLKKYMVLDDSLFNKEKLAAIAEVEAKFETEKKEAQLAKQQLEIERETAQKKTILIGAFAGLLALAAGFLLFRNRQKIKQQETELAAKFERAEANKLREMDTMKSIFFTNISHEFRTPLTLIVSPLRQLLDNPSERPKLSLFRTMLLSGERLLELVNQLLDLAKAEAGQLELHPVETDVLPVLRGIAGSFTSLADVRMVRFETAMPEGEILARFDKDKLTKIVANLLSNAFKFTPEEGQVNLEIKTIQTGGGNGQTANSLLLTVRDNGIGISKEDLSHLFERFYRAKDVAKSGMTGSGIGLALTKELIELHGGTIKVESPDSMQGSNGTAFKVWLPILVGMPNIVSEALKIEVLSGNRELVEQTAVKEQAVFPNPGQAQVLVVEDNPDVRLFIKSCLEKHHNIILAHDGKHGLETAREHIPDLIISDVMMPNMDGYELCHALKTDARTSHIPVVLLTARAEHSDKLAGLETGADDYLVKPFDSRELQIRVANLIEQRKKLQDHFRKTLNTFAPADIVANSMDAVFLQNVRDSIEANLDNENFSVVELGNRIGMSRSQLHRKLSALTGHSPNEVIRNMRLERAKQLLDKNVGTVSEVAYLCGFNSPAYFNKCFKDYFGVTPGEVG